jgi:HAD superfamily PSPase-like hydrolase
MIKYKVAAFDMDGTLLKDDSSWVAIHKHFGTEEIGKSSLELYTRGKITYSEFMKRDIAAWPRGIRRQEIEEILSNYRIRDEAKYTVSKLKAMGIEPVIVTSGIDILASSVARDLGIKKWIANSLVFDRDDRLRERGICMVEPLRKDKAFLKMLSELKIEKSKAIAVGDTHYDLSFLRKAGIGFMLAHTYEAREPSIINIKKLDEIFNYI